MRFGPQPRGRPSHEASAVASAGAHQWSRRIKGAQLMEVTRSRRRRFGAVGLAVGAVVAATVAVVTAVPASAAACEAVQYTVNSQWGTGHNAAVSIKTGSESINGWKIEFDFPSGATVQNAWN